MTEPRQDITLLQLTREIEGKLELHLDSYYWLVAEISEIRVDQKGHCYITFVEKDEKTGRIAARMGAHCWSFKFRQISEGFMLATGAALSQGQEILCCVEVEMHSVYGLSLNILDIDSQYTIGELQRQRQQTIERLKRDGVLTLNRQQRLSKIPNRIAIISSDKAAGYEDFVNQLSENAYGFVFRTRLYGAVMQGENAPHSIISALEGIYADVDSYDCVLIIRGGGATSDLHCFDDYELAFSVANFPLPVITGIGHTRDLSVLDMVAYVSVKTPTAAAAWFIERLTEQLNSLENLALSLQNAVRLRVRGEINKISLAGQEIRHLVAIRRNVVASDIERVRHNAVFAMRAQLSFQRQCLELYVKRLEVYNPERIFRLGYSVIKHDGLPLTSANGLRHGDKLTAIFADQSEAELEVV